MKKIDSYLTFGSSASYVHNKVIVLGRRMSPRYPGILFEYKSMFHSQGWEYKRGGVEKERRMG